MAAEPMALVARTTALVEVVARRGPVGVSDLARSLEISKSGAYRIAQSLVARDWLVQDEALNYRLGPAVQGLLLSAGTPESLIGRMRPYMERLHRETQESIHLTHLDGRQVVYLEQLVSPRPVRSVVNVGGRSPAHAVSPGMAQLAYVTPGRLDWFLRVPLARFTPATLDSPASFRAELDAVRQRGYAVNVGNYRSDVGGVACTILEDGQPIGALSICSPAFRLPPDVVAEYGALLRQVVHEAGASREL